MTIGSCVPGRCSVTIINAQATASTLASTGCTSRARLDQIAPTRAGGIGHAAKVRHGAAQGGQRFGQSQGRKEAKGGKGRLDLALLCTSAIPIPKAPAATTDAQQRQAPRPPRRSARSRWRRRPRRRVLGRLHRLRLRRPADHRPPDRAARGSGRSAGCETPAPPPRPGATRARDTRAIQPKTNAAPSR